MKYKKLIVILLVLSLLLCGCGAQSAMDGGYANGEALNRNPALGTDSDVSTDATGTQTSTLPANQKLIRKVWLDAETEDMSGLIDHVEGRIAELGGYVEGRQIKNGSAYSGRVYRYAELTIRIPAEKLDRFVSGVAEVSNITDTRETTEDVTLSYVEYESKVVALETEQTQLLELMTQAKTMDDILKIQNRLTNIRAQLEQLKSQLRLYDNLVSYSTVYLSITEVKEYTPTTEPENMWERMGEGLSESWKDLVQGLENVLVGLVVASPYLLTWGLVFAGIGLIARAVIRKKKMKKTPPPEGQEK